MTGVFIMSRKQRLNTILTEALLPSTLIIEDESQKHARGGLETHFKLILVSTQFNTLKRIERHRLVHQLVREELNSGLHALSLFLYTEDEWDKKTEIPQSPDCQTKKHEL